MGNVVSVVSKGALVAVRSQVAKQIVSTVVGAIVGAKVGDIYQKCVIGTQTPAVVVEN
jgi:outer membrane lipoprotein SlyB